MKKARISLLMVLIFLSSPIFALQKRADPISVKTSVIIPCHYKHAQYLPALLQAFEEQTVPPDEVVISLSEWRKTSNEVMDLLLNRSRPFPVVLLRFEEPVSEGDNRNRASSKASGDVFICHDADDLPHPQRVEVIKYFFENYWVDHLMHRWGGLELLDSPKFNNFDQIAYFQTDEYTNLLGSGTYTNGPVAFSRYVFDAIQWDRAFREGVDVTFNQAVYRKYVNKLVLDVPLYIYRHTLSSYK